MDLFEKPCYNVNRIILSVAGLWPYNESMLTDFHRAVLFFIILFMTIVQLTSFLTCDITMDQFCTILSGALPCLIVLVRYASCLILTQKTKHLFNSIRGDWKMFTGPTENELLEHYAYISRQFTLAFMCVSYTTGMALGIVLLSPMLFDIVVPLNSSRPRDLLITVEYFVDQDEYYYLMALHLIMSCVVIFTVIVATESTMIIASHHACGIYSIARNGRIFPKQNVASINIEYVEDEGGWDLSQELYIHSYRIQNAINDAAFEISASERNCSSYVKICHAIEIHRKAIRSVLISIDTACALLLAIAIFINISARFSMLARGRRYIEYENSTQAGSYFIPILIAVAALSVSLHRIFQAAMTTGKGKEMVVIGLILLCEIVFMYLNNWSGQTVMDKGAEVFQNMYDTVWYKVPLRIQKLLLFIMQRSAMECKLIVGGVFVTSLKGFASLISTAFSYFTVMFSVN